MRYNNNFKKLIVNFKEKNVENLFKNNNGRQLFYSKLARTPYKYYLLNYRRSLTVFGEYTYNEVFWGIEKFAHNSKKYSIFQYTSNFFLNFFNKAGAKIKFLVILNKTLGELSRQYALFMEVPETSFMEYLVERHAFHNFELLFWY